MNTNEHGPVTLVDGALLDTVADTQRKLKLGRTKIYELMNAGHLQVVKLGRNTRIVASSTQRLVSDLLTER